MPTKKIVKPAKREKSTSTKSHYVSNAQILAALERDQKTGKLSNELAGYLYLIAERYSYSPNFVNYSFREDMVSVAVMNLCSNWHKFDPSKSQNPFAFYTTAVFRSFLQYLADEKKHRDIRDNLLIDAGSNPSFGFSERQAGKTHDDTAFRSFGSEE